MRKYIQCTVPDAGYLRGLFLCIWPHLCRREPLWRQKRTKSLHTKIAYLRTYKICAKVCSKHDPAWHDGSRFQVAPTREIRNGRTYLQLEEVAAKYLIPTPSTQSFDSNGKWMLTNSRCQRRPFLCQKCDLETKLFVLFALLKPVGGFFRVNKSQSLTFQFQQKSVIEFVNWKSLKFQLKNSVTEYVKWNFS
jgi:hypothetical protein